jgi:hypothetical protein
MNHPESSCQHFIDELVKIPDIYSDVASEWDGPEMTDDNGDFGKSIDLLRDILLIISPGFDGRDGDISMEDESHISHQTPCIAIARDKLNDRGQFVEEFRGAAKTFGAGSTFMNKFDMDQFAEERRTNLYFPFASKEEWDVAAFLLRSPLSMPDIDNLLSLKLVHCAVFTLPMTLITHQIQSLDLSFSTAKELRGRAEILPPGPKWKCTPWKTIYPTKTPVHLYHRDPIQCIESIMQSPWMTNHIHYTPLRVFTNAQKLMRVYSEWRTGDVAWEMQVPIFMFSAL